MVVRVNNAERGVSLAETLVALFILSVVGVATISGVVTSVNGNDMVRTRITAESLARTELEYVNSQPYRTDWTSYTLTLPTDHPAYPIDWDQTHTMPDGYTGYSITVTASEKVIGTTGAKSNKQKISAVVSYNGGAVLNMSMYLAER